MPELMPQPAVQEAPMGASSATGPTPNRGLEAAGMQKLAMIVKQMTELLPLLGAGSEPGQAVLKCLSSLSKHVQPGAVTPIAEQNHLQQAMIQNIQNAAMMKQMQAASMQGGAGGPPGASPGGPPGMGGPPMGARAA